MNIDGKTFSHNVGVVLKSGIDEAGVSMNLGVLVFRKDSVTEQFTRIKQETGETLGVGVNIIECSETSTTEEAISLVKKYAEKHDGIIVQLPLPKHIDTEKVLQEIPEEKDVDGIGKQAKIKTVLPPVVAAIREILNQYSVEPKGKEVVIVGKGRLVGGPAATWFTDQGANVKVISRSTEDLEILIKAADIIVLGAGVPGLIQPDMVRDGVVVLDAGSGEVEGRVLGDADPKVAEKASLFTPTPGGIGPIAVSMIFVNLFTLYKNKK